MERTVLLEGKPLGVFEWVGMLQPDIESAINALEECFRAFPLPFHTHARFDIVVRILSAHVTAPLSGLEVDAMKVPRNREVEAKIQAGFVQTYGMRRLEKFVKKQAAAKKVVTT